MNTETAMGNLLENCKEVSSSLMYIATAIDAYHLDLDINLGNADYNVFIHKDHGVFYKGVRLTNPIDFNEWINIDLEEVLKKIKKGEDFRYVYKEIEILLEEEYEDEYLEQDKLTLSLGDGLASDYQFAKIYRSIGDINAEKLKDIFEDFYKAVMNHGSNLGMEDFLPMFDQATDELADMHDNGDKFQLGELTAWFVEGYKYIKFYKDEGCVYAIPTDEYALDVIFSDTEAFRLFKENLTIGRALKAATDRFNYRLFLERSYKGILDI